MLDSRWSVGGAANWKWMKSINPSTELCSILIFTLPVMDYLVNTFGDPPFARKRTSDSTELVIVYGTNKVL